MPRHRSNALEDVVSATFASQGFALGLLPFAFALTTELPYHLLMSFRPPTIDVSNPQAMIGGMEQAGIVGGLISLLPMVRLIGLTLVFFAGVALATSHRRAGYLSIIRSAVVSRTIGWAAIAIGALLIATQGLYVSQADAASQRAVSVIAGAARPQMAGPAQVQPYVGRQDPSAAQPAPQPATYRRSPSNSLTPGLDARNQMSEDRPFPPNGTIERTLPLGDNVAAMMFSNRTSENAIALWYYRIGDGGEQEALRAYVAAGQSVIVQLPTFDYRMAAFTAPTSQGLDSGFGPRATMHDLGYINLKTPASAEIRHVVYTLIAPYYGVTSNGITSNIAKRS